MRRTLTLATLLVSPLLAAAQAEAPAAPPAAPSAPEWSIGGGVTLLVFSSGPFTVVYPGYSSISLPSTGATASVERRLSERTWLVAGAHGSVTRYRSDVPSGSYGVERDDTRMLMLSGGVRRILTPPTAAVEVSLMALGEAGVGDGERREISYSGASTAYDETTWFVGVNAGIAVERELTGGLSVRIASPLLHASYDWRAVDAAGQPKTHTTGLDVSAYLAPRLELRMAF